MAPKFDHLKFNLMRAIELFEDMNHEDMDVTAPPSSVDLFKEQEVAEHLNECLCQLIVDGVFDDCDLREEEEDIDDEELDSEEAQREDSLPVTPRSDGFEFETDSSTQDDEEATNGRRGSRESFTDRFKRYIKRILPGKGGSARRSGRSAATGAQGRQSSASLSYSRDGEEYDDEGPYDPVSSHTEIGRHDHHTIHDHHHHGERSRSSSGSSPGSQERELSYDREDSSFIDDEPIGSGRGTTSRSSSASSRRSGRTRSSSRSTSASRRAGRRRS